uniref:Protein phosphatase 1 regulatory subunit 35 C-terminal domain-containing protein n=1 Tax=Xiphophorus couchianus TaxID=32473 RepID=A0A3B5LKE1_9TELE
MSFSILDSSSPSPNTIPAPFPSHSCVTHCPELDLSVSLSPAPNPDHMQQKTCRLKQSQHSDEPQQRPHPRRQTERKRNTKVCFEEPEAVRVTPDRRIVPHQHHLRGQRGSSKYSDNHVSLFLVLQEMEFNSKKALQQTLLKSRRTKTLIDARAIEVVNVSPSQHLFNSLVSVSVQEDELLSQVLQAKLILAPLPSHYYKSAESPSLNFFITSELFRKKPLQQEEEPAKCKPSPMACPAYSTFDLYRRQRCWEAIP